MSDPRVGKVFSIRGQGPCLIVQIFEGRPAWSPDGGWPPEPCVLWAPHGFTYLDAMAHTPSTGRWGPVSFLRGSEVTPEILREAHKQAKARNVACEAPDCWCVKMREVK